MHQKIYSLGAEQGAVLLTTLVMLVLLTLLGLTTMKSTTMEERMSANSQQTQQLFQSVDSGVSIALRNQNLGLSLNNAYTSTVNIGGFNVTTITRFRQRASSTGRSADLNQQYDTSFERVFFEINASIAPNPNIGSGRTGAAAVQAGIVQIVPGSQ